MEPFTIGMNRNLVLAEGALNDHLLKQILNDKPKAAAVITGKSAGELAQVKQFLAGLKAGGVEAGQWIVSGEPSYVTVDAIIAETRTLPVELVVAIGGGSVMDAGKAVSMMLTQEGSLKDYLEGVGTQSPAGTKVPFIAVPTTAGTGSEATKNGVINGTDDEPFKKSFRHDNFIPDQAVIDPALAVSCPPGVTAASGMDAVTQLLEAFTSTGSNPVTDALAESGLVLIAESLEAAVTDGTDLEARGGMAYAAWCSGFCLGNADLGAVHGIAGPLGASFKIPHGAACGILLPHVTEAVIRKLIVNAQPGSENFRFLVKYARAGYLLNGEMESGFDIAEGCRKLMERLQSWSAEFQLGKLSDYGVTKELAAEIAAGSKSRLSPVQFTQEELQAIIVAAC